LVEPIDVRHLMSDLGVGRFKLDPGAVIGIAGHHSVSATFYQVLPDETQADEVEHLEAIDRMHQALGWGAIGYHLAAFASRRLYLCGSLNGARAHVASRNHELIGIVLIGDFSTIPPTPAHIETAAAGVEYIRRLYPGRHLAPHRLWALPEYPTGCPGDTWAAWLPAVNQPPGTEDDMKLIRGMPSTRVFVVGESGKRQLSTSAEHNAYTGAGYGTAEVPDDQADAIPNAPQPLRLLRGVPSGGVFVLGVGGKRHIDDPAEWQAYRDAGWADRDVSDAVLAAIPDAGS
jgi:hypothetical protein